MKILNVINTLSAGGAELHLLSLCRYLKREGIEIVVVCLRENVRGSRSLRPDFEKDEIRVINLRADSRYDWRFFSRFACLLRQEQPDILHSHLPRADLAAAYTSVVYPHTPWVSSVHGIYSESWSGHWTLPLANRVWRRANVVVAISHAVKEWLVTQQRAPADRLTVIYYGIDPEKFAAPRADLRKAWGLEGHTVIGSIGRIEHGKGYDCLIQAMPDILDRVPGARLFIAGHDPSGYEKQLRKLVESLGLQEYVHLVGFQDDVVSFLHLLDVFAFASRSEGFGQVVIEAMAAGKPVVASAIPALSEIVLDGQTGFSVETEDRMAFARAISWLACNEGRAKDMGIAGKQRVRNCFSIERETAETLRLYRNLMPPCAESLVG